MMIGILLVLAGTILLFLIISFVGWLIGLYNRLINAQQNIKTQWANILAEYQRRADLFYNLVQAVKSYAKFEKETMIQVTQARAGNFGLTTTEQLKKIEKLEDAFTNILSRIMAVVEKYPKLRAVEEYHVLNEEIRITEDRINIARSDFNEVIRDYNVMVKTFPSNMFARHLGFQEENYYVNAKEDIDYRDYKVKFD